MRSSPLPDFYIGGHAQAENRTLVMHDAARYRSYFPGVVLIAPT
jgi:predicted nucleic acid-binding protein